MTLRDTLHELIKNTLPSIKVLAVYGTPTSTRIKGVDENRTTYLDTMLSTPIADFACDFGIPNLDILKGLLGYSGYKADGSEITVKQAPWKTSTFVETIQFRTKGGVGAEFRCMNPERVPDQAEIKSMPWNAQIKPTSAKIAEFSQLASIFASVDAKKLFGVKIVGSNLVAHFGSDHATTHNGSMILEEGVKAAFTKDPLWSHADFISLMKLAGSQETTVRFCDKGVLGVEIATPIGAFKYYMRSQER